MEDKNDRLNTRRKPLALAMGSFRNGDYIRSLDNKGLSVVLGVIIDEFIKSALADPQYPYTLDEQIRAAHDWLNKPVNHDGKMVKELSKRLDT